MPSIQSAQLQGMYTALMTPMLDSGHPWAKEIDFPKLEKLLDVQLAAQVRGILACGTTGQSASLDDDFLNLAVFINTYVQSKSPDTQLIYGAGSNSTGKAIKQTRSIEVAVGPATFLHVTGYYNNPTQEGLINHFTTIADNLVYPESNIIMYNVPGRTNSKLEAKTVIELAKHPKIIGIKEASGDLEHVRQIIKGTDRSRFTVLSGEDDQVTEIIRIGGYGVISAAANVAPRYFVEMTEYALKGDHTKAAEMQEHILPLVQAVFAVKNPIPLAYMLHSNVRIPLVGVLDLKEPKRTEVLKKIHESLELYKLDNLGINLDNFRISCRYPLE